MANPTAEAREITRFTTIALAGALAYSRRTYRVGKKWTQRAYLNSKKDSNIATNSVTT